MANEEVFKARVHALHNAYLKKKGGKPRKRSASLDKAADWYAGEMAAGRAPFEHGNWAQRLKRFIGHRRANGAALAENIAYGQDDPEAVVRAWINSPGHERNMRDRTLRKVGYGYAERIEQNGSTTEFWVVDFGTF